MEIFTIYDYFLKKYLEKISKLKLEIQVKLIKNYNIAIIHGKGLGILKKTTHEVLRKNKRVLDFKIYYFNDGMTIVKLKK